MKIGYARVSTKDQNLDLQIEALQKAGCKRFFKERISGKTTENRPEFLKMLEQIREGDVVIVWKLDRLARNTRDLLKTVEEIHDAGAKFVSLSEPWMDTTTPMGKLLLTVCAGLAEFERELIAERRTAGIERAKRNGVKFGPKEKLTKEKRELVIRLRGEGKSVKDISELVNVHRSTIYRMENE